MKTITLLVGLLLISLTISAQKNFQDQVAAHGKDAVYQRYYSVYMDDDDKLQIQNAQGQFTIEPNYFGTIPSGFNIISTGDEVWDNGEVYVLTDVTGRYYKAIGHPEVSHYLHSGDRSAWVAMEDYVIELSGMNKEGTAFNRFETIYILQDATPATPAKDDGKKKKKKGFLSKLKDFKEAVKSGTGGGKKFGPAYQRVATRDLRAEITEHLKNMKIKQAQLTGAQKAEAKNLINAKTAGEAYVKRYNDSIFATPEHQKMLAHQRRMAKMEAGDRAASVTLENRTGKDIYIYEEGSRNGSRLSNGSTTSVPCKKNAYFTYSSSSSVNGDGSRCYSAGSGCGSSVTIN